MATSHALAGACRSAGALHAMLDARATAMNRRTATIVNGTSYAIRYDAANRVVEEWMQTAKLPEAHAGVAYPGNFNGSKPVEPTAPPPGSCPVQRSELPIFSALVFLFKKQVRFFRQTERLKVKI
ncbi:MAG: hypothetical protein HY253_05150 [Burkholderiales bacterium]|nr:hypothetical protein [Burkholderiales bacterium]